MSMTTSTIFFGCFELLIESMGWGLFGFLAFRLLGGWQKRWYIDWLIIYTIFMLWNFWSNTYLLKLDITIGNQEVSDLFNHDLNSLFEVGYFDFVLGAGQIFLGYWFGRWVLKRLKKRDDQKAPIQTDMK